MTATTTTCVYCHRLLGRSPHATPDHPYVCDLCSEAIRTHVDIVPLSNPSPTRHKKPATRTTTPRVPGERKSKRNSDRKPAVVATALLGMLLLFAGCTIHHETHLEWGGLHRETTLDIQCDPRQLGPPPDPALTEP